LFYFLLGLFQVQISKWFHLVLFLGFLADFILLFRVSTIMVSNFGLPSSCLLTTEGICTGSIGHGCRSPFTLMIHSWGLSLPLQADFLPRFLLDCVSSKGSHISLEAFQLSAYRGQLWGCFLPYEVSVLALFVRVSVCLPLSDACLWLPVQGLALWSFTFRASTSP